MSDGRSGAQIYEQLRGEMKLLREMTDAVASGKYSNALIGNAFKAHVLSYRNILNVIESAVSEKAATGPCDCPLEGQCVYKDGSPVCERIEDQRASAASPSVATADSPQGAAVQSGAHPTASDTPRTDEYWHERGDGVYANKTVDSAIAFCRTLEREAAALRRERDEAAAREREACAVLCEKEADFSRQVGHPAQGSLRNLASAIRARSGEGRK